MYDIITYTEKDLKNFYHPRCPLIYEKFTTIPKEVPG